MSHTKTPGFTLVELLIVIAIVALVGTMAAVAVNAARSKQRDATRVAHVRQMQSALENFFNENNRYPAGQNVPLGDPAYSACFSTDGFVASCPQGVQVLMRIVPPTFEKGLSGDVVCGAPLREAFCYTQKQEGQNYGIEFELEHALSGAGLVEGANCATQNGLAAGRCR